MGSANGHLLEVTNLHVRRDQHEILRGVSLAVAPRTIHAVLGPNGSGKSTLAYALMGSLGYTPHAGEIRFEGQEITHLSIYERAERGLTMTWQEPARFEGLTVERYLSLGMHEPDPSAMRAALRSVSLDPDLYLQRLVDDSLSGGERKRVELAAVQVMQPKLAILDEADSGIDAVTLKDIARLIRRMARAGTAVLLISHHDEVVASADIASLLCRGLIAETGQPAHVCRRYTRLFAHGAGGNGHRA
jgi:Fe-S cluster assembly ATP-binding protein